MVKFLDDTGAGRLISGLFTKVQGALDTKLAKNFLLTAMGGYPAEDWILTSAGIDREGDTLRFAGWRIRPSQGTTGSLPMQLVSLADFAKGDALAAEISRASAAEALLVPRDIASALLTALTAGQFGDTVTLTLDGVNPADGSAVETTAQIDLSHYERAENKVPVSSGATEEQYPTAKSVFDFGMDIAAQIPAGGLAVPLSLDLESELPDDLSGVAVGAYWYIQNMDVSAPEHTGRAWVNDDGADGAKVIHRVIDQYGAGDGETITQTGGGALQVSAAWLEGFLAARGYALAADLGALATKNSVGTGEIDAAAVTLSKLAAAVQTSLGRADSAVQPAAISNFAVNYNARNSGVFSGCSTLEQLVARLESVFAGTTAITGIDVS
jgi:hypothetical protein